MITAKLLREWNACWSDERIAAFGKSEMSPREVAACESISLDDRLWVLCRSLWHLDESAARGFAIESASLVTHLAGNEDDQSQHAALLNRLLEIEDLPADQRGAAREAAWGAAREAARGAAREAAREAAWEAAWEAAREAAWGAAREAAWGAARDAARAAELRKAIARALEWLGDYTDGWEEA